MYKLTLKDNRKHEYQPHSDKGWWQIDNYNNDDDNNDDDQK